MRIADELQSPSFFCFFFFVMIAAQKSKNSVVCYVWFCPKPGFHGCCTCRKSLTSNTVLQISGSYSCICSEIFRNFLMCHHATRHIQQFTVYTLYQSIMLRCITTCHLKYNAVNCKEVIKLDAEKLFSTGCMLGSAFLAVLVLC